MNQKRRDGTLIVADDAQDRLLSLLYGSALGRAIIKPLTQPCISKAA